MPTYNQIFLVVEKIDSKSIDLRVELSDLLEPHNSTSYSLTIDNPVDDKLKEQLLWIFENDDRNDVHENAVNLNMRVCGAKLYHALFLSEAFLSHNIKLSKCFLRIYCPVSFPWEILYNPYRQNYVIAEVKGFSRVAEPSLVSIRPMLFIEAPIRILLVVTRPFKFRDVQFRTIAQSLFATLTNNASYEISVLRPATIAGLTKTLAEAKSNGQPFQLVHFDGHGVHGSENIAGLNPLKGYIVFEDNQGKSADFIEGEKFGRLLKENGTEILVLNACRSGYKNTQYTADEDPEEPTPALAFGSFAEEVAQCGLSAVIAMQYKVPVEAALLFTHAFYHFVAKGESVENGFMSATQVLVHEKNEYVTLPVLYQKQPVILKQKRKGLLKWAKEKISGNQPATYQRIAGFDDWIVRLEKAFEHSPLVILSGMEGSGKSSLSVEYGKWAIQSGLIDEVIRNPKESVEPVLDQINAQKERNFLVEFSAPQSAETIKKFHNEVQAINPRTKIIYKVNASDKNSLLQNFPEIHINGLELEEDGLGEEINGAHHMTLEATLEHYRGNPLTLKTLLQSIDGDQKKFPVIDPFEKIATKTLTESILADDFEQHFSEVEHNQLYLLGCVANYFDEALINTLLEVALPELGPLAPSLIQKGLQYGFIGYFSANRSERYCLHPLMAVYLQRSWKTLQPETRRQEILTAIGQILQKGIENGNPFEKKRQLRNATCFVQCCLRSATPVDLTFWLKTLDETQLPEAFLWSAILEQGLRVFDLKGTTTASIATHHKNLTLFTYYELKHQFQLFNFAFAESISANVHLLFEHFKQHPANTPIEVETCAWLIRTMALFHHTMLESIRVETYDRHLHLTVIEELEAAKSMLTALEPDYDNELLAQINYLLGEYRCLVLKNHTLWFSNLQHKKEEIDAEQLTNDLVRFYLKMVDTTDHFFAHQNLKKANEVLLANMAHLLQSGDIPLSPEELNHLETVVLGQKFQQTYTSSLSDFSTALALTQDNNLRLQIETDRNRLIRAVRGKLLYCLLNHNETFQLNGSGLYTDTARIEQLIDLDAKATTPTAKQLIDYVNTNYPLQPESDLEQRKNQIKSLLYRQEYNAAIELFEAIRKELLKSQLLIQATIFRAEFLIDLYINVKPQTAISGFETPIWEYIKREKEEISLSFLMLEWMNAMRIPETPFADFEKWTDHILKTNDASEVNKILHQHTGSLAEHIGDRLRWLSSQLDKELEAEKALNSFFDNFQTKLENLIAIMDGEKGDKRNLSPQELWNGLEKIDQSRELHAHSIRRTANEHYDEEMLIFAECLYIHLIANVGVDRPQLVKLTQRAEKLLDRLHDTENPLEEKPKEYVERLREPYQNWIGELIYQQGRLANKRFGVALKDQNFGIQAGLLAQNCLEKHCETIPSTYLSQLINKEGLDQQAIQQIIHHWSFIILFDQSNIEQPHKHLDAHHVKKARKMIELLADFPIDPEMKANERAIKATMRELICHWDVMELMLISQDEAYAGTIVPFELEKILNRLTAEFIDSEFSKLSELSEFKSPLLHGSSNRKRIREAITVFTDYHKEQMEERSEIAKGVKEGVTLKTQNNIYE